MPLVRSPRCKYLEQNLGIRLIAPETVKHWIKKLVQQTQPGTVLHAGCGKGELTALLVRQNPALE